MQHKKTVIARDKSFAVFSLCFYGSLKNKHALKKSKNITLKLTNKSILVGPLGKKKKCNKNTSNLSASFLGQRLQNAMHLLTIPSEY